VTSVLLAYFKTPARWTDVARQTVHEIGDDNCFGLAAQLAFYFLLALFPAILFLVALASYLPVENALAELVAALGAVAPAELVALLRAQLDQLAEGRHASLLTLGIVGAIWSSSAAMVAIIDALNHAYDISEWRPWWKRRFVAIALTMSLALFTLVALAFVLIGPSMASRAAAWFGLAPAVALVWQLMRWPIIVLSVVAGVDLVYHFAPNRTARWAWITPGALVATAVWIASSFAFKFYVSNVADYSATYGTIGGVIVTMLWFYVSGLALLIGAELNAVVEATWQSNRSDGAIWQMSRTTQREHEATNRAVPKL
jgi:membrane protein